MNTWLTKMPLICKVPKYKYTVSTYVYNSWPSFTCTIPGCYLEIIKYNLEQVGSRQKCRLWSFGSHKFGSSWCIMTFNLNFSLKCYFAQDFARQLNKPRLLVLWSPLSWLKRCFFLLHYFLSVSSTFCHDGLFQLEITSLFSFESCCDFITVILSGRACKYFIHVAIAMDMSSPTKGIRVFGRSLSKYVWYVLNCTCLMF